MLQTILTVIPCFFLAITAVLYAGDSNDFQVYVMQTKGGCAKLERIPPDANLLFSGKEVVKLDWAHQAFLLNDEATKRLLPNASEVESGKEDIVPRGQFFESDGKSFAIVLKGKIIVSGIVAGMSTLQEPPGCALLYPDLPMVDHGKVVLGIGIPKKEAKLHADFFKLLVEEGPERCFSPVLPVEVRDYFQK